MPDMIYQRAKYRRLLLPVLLLSAAMSGCGGQQALVEPKVSGSRDTGSVAVLSKGEQAAAIAKDQLGVRYKYGGASKSGFDCSGLVWFAYSEIGLALPRTTGGLWSALTPVSRPELRPGDVIFFNIAGKVSHVGLYLGGARFVHAPVSGRVVEMESLDSDFYRNAYIRGGRIN